MQRLITFGAAASLVLVLVLAASVQVTVALGAVTAVAIVVRDMVGPGGGSAGAEMPGIQLPSLPKEVKQEDGEGE
ncbi:hypothetical protein ACFYW8_23060 [Streptomyces sp. NPDC002742]|uniref:hypothetical protein n=1 Tax=Streptomyces sp. NPDC002742 TaxID=3364663 RepID=UPI00369E4763